MLKTFISSFKLRNTYKANSIIYLIKSLPIIKKILPESLYANDILKVFANVIGGIIEIFSTFVGKIVYIPSMVILPLLLMDKLNISSIITVLFFLTIIGGIFNTNIFNPTKDKYYAIFLMRMSAKEYTKTDYIFFLLKTFIGFLAVLLVTLAIISSNLIFSVLISLFVVQVKVITSAIMLRFNKTRNENKFSPIFFITGIILLISAYATVYFNVVISELMFIAIFGVCLIASIFSMIYILKFNSYRKICKNLYSDSSFIQINNQSTTQVQQELYLKKLEFSVEQTSDKTGYSYFNDIFVKRHRKLLTKSAKRIAFISGIIFICGVIACIAFPSINKDINDFVLNFLPYFLFVMYLLNRGNNITQAMFMNCDHSMLSYRFYRQPKTILYVFAERLKSIIKINLLPAAIIAIGLPILLLISGGTSNPINYIIIFVSIISMSVFFSVHSIVLYYLLQPYNAEIEMKNPLFSIISGITYFICYLAIGRQMPTIIFGSVVSAFCIIYVVVSLFLAYKLAPKTFKLR